MPPSSSASPVGEFDYEATATIQGRGELSSHQRDLAGMRLARCLHALPGVPGRLLLVGCGAGRHVRALAQARPDLVVHGSDLSLTALREAVRAGGDARYTAADALALPYGDKSFDIVVLFDLLEHVPDVGRAVAEIARVLRPGGAFHGFIPCEAQPGTLFAAMLKGRPVPIHRWKRDHVGHIQQLTVAQVEALFTAHGLHPLHRSYSFHAVGQVHDMLDYWNRETTTHAQPGARRTGITRLTRLLMIGTWRLAYLEAQVLRAWPAATGLHLTAMRIATPPTYTRTA
jgi:ubiquinone/menaquinone biosynthesis C-methylase UbiE